ncbi:MAG: (d)CMP kinase [Chthoniobacterales bacterium]
MSRPVVIAIDGPAASGKSSVARGLAAAFGFSYINSGAMYRAFTWHVLNRGIDPADSEAVATAAKEARIETGFEDGRSTIDIDGFRPIDQLRDESVNRAVSAVSAVEAVRDRLVEAFRVLASRHNVIIEGRDIGSVVFPDTPYKFYLDAPADIRQRRRAAEGQHDEVASRDHLDSSRRTAPLVVAPDAIVVDTSCLDLAGVIEEVSRHLVAMGLSPQGSAFADPGP